jgi:hypothetical protein
LSFSLELGGALGGLGGSGGLGVVSAVEKGIAAVALVGGVLDA